LIHFLFEISFNTAFERLKINKGESIMDKEETLAKQKGYLWPNQLLYYTEPLPLERGEDIYVRDVDGERYLGFCGGILTASVGHNNPVVNQRIKEQVDKLLHSSALYPHENQVALTEGLAGITPGDLDTFYFGASGIDADETAVVTAQVFTGNQEVIVLRRDYSGKSPVAVPLTSQQPLRIGPNHIGYIRHALAKAACTAILCASRPL
jgi:alanine-glyoxylate transaminase/(R)-3-amino-2-methylpropionate-pyruvate transaminase